MEFVRSDILLGACAVWEGGFTEVTGWVLPAGIKLMQTTGNENQVLWVKHYRSSDLSKTDYVRNALFRFLQLLSVLFTANTDILGSFEITLAWFPAEFWEDWGGI